MISTISRDSWTSTSQSSIKRTVCILSKLPKPRDALQYSRQFPNSEEGSAKGSTASSLNQRVDQTLDYPLTSLCKFLSALSSKVVILQSKLRPLPSISPL